MKVWSYVTAIVPCLSVVCGQFLYDTFADGFMWSTATSAHQIEGGWDADGKGENIWDRFCHEHRVADNHTADVACDSYNRYTEDVALLQNLGVGYYRFSIAWSRLLPNGTLAGGVNEPGVAYYNSLIDALIAANVIPVITLYHWDLPQPLQDIEGWENEALVPHFRDYAELCYQRFGTRVKYWITFNEPFVVAWLGYGQGVFAPSKWDEPGEAPYRVTHTILKSHAEAWHLYNDNYRATQGGLVSITLDSDWKEPQDQTQPSIDAAERAMQFKLGWFANPIFGASGDYPAIMRSMVDDKSEGQGFNESRLPYFTQDEIDRIRGTHDFFGLNHYTTQLVYNQVHGLDCVSYSCDSDTGEEQDPSWPETGSSWLKVVPWGLRRLLNWITDSYGHVPILITENGCSDRNSSINDTHRINYFTEYINEALKANKTDNVNLVGYTAWSLMDNFEWGQGYNEKFGIHYVDFSDPARPRTVKESARVYGQIIRDNGFPEPMPDHASRAAGHLVTVVWVAVLGYLVGQFAGK